MIHAAVVLACLILASGLVGYMAMPALAALLMLVAWNMCEPHKWMGYLSAWPSDRVLLILTMGLTVLVDLTVAIGVGVMLGLAIRLRRGDAPIDWHTPER